MRQLSSGRDAGLITSAMSALALLASTATEPELAHAAAMALAREVLEASERSR